MTTLRLCGRVRLRRGRAAVSWIWEPVNCAKPVVEGECVEFAQYLTRNGALPQAKCWEEA
jgi:hypothetical protein